jgi:hypothetical protein
LATSCDLDELELLILELGASLPPAQYNAFAAAAHVALGNCSGVGIAYRILRDLQRSYFDPPADGPGRYEPRHFRRGKPTDLPPLADDSARGRAARQTRWMRGWRG